MLERLTISPCCNPEYDLETALKCYSNLGFTQFEAFTSWAKSALDYNIPTESYREIFEKHNMRVTSFHLPRIDGEASFLEAVKAAKFADELGAEVMLYKANSRELYVNYAKKFTELTEHLKIIPVIQNHYGTPLTTLSDVKEVTEGISGFKNLLEVGHFHSAGVSWREGYDYLGIDRVSLVHIKDQAGSQSVPFGSGEIDLKGLFLQLENDGYKGKYVVEMEVSDSENTEKYLAMAIEYLKNEVQL